MAEQEEAQLQICNDVLETILSHLPLVDLVSAAQVSGPWHRAVAASLRNRKNPEPWLILHTQGVRHPYATATQAYDPRSQLWMKIHRHFIEHVAALRSSHSSLLYMLSPSKLSFSSDPFNLTWNHVESPSVWRVDPIVALVGETVIVAGGACDFEEDPLAVEIYSSTTQAWRTCEPMPGIFKDSPASTGQSVAATADRLVVADKRSGITHSFDPGTGSWSAPIRLRPDRPVCQFNIGSVGERLILVGLCGIEDVERVFIWGFDLEDSPLCEEIGEMPLEYVDRLRSESFGTSSIKICAAGNTVYMYNPSEVREVVACELNDGGVFRWWSVQSAAAPEETMMHRLVFSCSEVGIDELRRVLKDET